MISRFITLLFTVLMAMPNVRAQDISAIADLKLRNTDGRWLAMNDFSDARGFILIFTCNHCPFAKLYSKRLNDLHRQYSAQGVPLLAINPMDTLVYDEERFEFMVEKSARDNFLFPYLHDNLQLFARYMKATHTPQAFVVWKNAGGWEVVYQGAIDDNGAEPGKAHSYISDALEALLQHKKPPLLKTDSFGCRIYLRESK
jgi:hypothetical protein